MNYAFGSYYYMVCRWTISPTDKIIPVRADYSVRRALPNAANGSFGVASTGKKHF